jgi:hypothetical protein
MVITIKKEINLNSHFVNSFGLAGLKELNRDLKTFWT